MRILTWHVHGAYLRSLLTVDHEWLIPVQRGRPPHFAGLPTDGPPWPSNAREIPAEEVPHTPVDLVLFQHHREWSQRHDLLGPEQLAGPLVFVEHDPPFHGSPTDTRHPVADASEDVTLVHVTPYNALMWDSGDVPTAVVAHGVPDHGSLWTGELDRGIAVVNNLAERGRRLGADVFARAAAEVPLDLVGMGAEIECKPQDLPAFEARYRFFFNPIRYTSLGMAVCEAMMLGMPVVALATTEHAVAVRDGVCGYTSADVDELIGRMRELLADRALAARLGEGARAHALERYGLERFAAEWTAVLEGATRSRAPSAPGWPSR
ncbi:MAG TPA: glycosyltransferase [Capillimicrobium sp.]|jgi:glycosyltransferase involved in cell wall biosynthesis